MVQPLWKMVWQVFIKLNILLLYDPTVTILDIYPSELKALSTQNLHTDVCRFIHNCQNVEATKMSFSS